MLKKLISLLTASILLGTGVSVLAAPASSAAACSSGLLSPTSSIKGVTIDIGSYRADSAFSDFYTPGPLRSSVTLTSAEASGTGITALTSTDGSPVYWLYIAPGINSFSHRTISGTSNQANETLVDGRDFIIRIAPTTCDEQYYWVEINVGSSSSSSSAPTLSAAEIAANAAAAAKAVAEAAAAVRAAEVAVAQTKLSTVLKEIGRAHV